MAPDATHSKHWSKSKHGSFSSQLLQLHRADFTTQPTIRLLFTGNTAVFICVHVR